MACNEWFKIGGCHRESDITNKWVVIKSHCSISSYLRPVIKEKFRLISQSFSVNGTLTLDIRQFLLLRPKFLLLWLCRSQTTAFSFVKLILKLVNKSSRNKASMKVVLNVCHGPMELLLHKVYSHVMKFRPSLIFRLISLPSATELRRLCFYRCLSVHRGGVPAPRGGSASVHAGTPPAKETPTPRRPPKETPHQGDPPAKETPLPRRSPPERRPLLRMVRILLECILVL